MMCLSPSAPFPSTTPPKSLVSRPTSCKLSLFIPATNTSSNVDCGFTPAPPTKQTSTPIRTSRPKLSLSLGSTENVNNNKRPATSLPPLTLNTSIASKPSLESLKGEDDDLTARNTLANSQIKSDGCFAPSTIVASTFPCYTLPSGTKSILKKSVGFASRSKAVSFETAPSYIPTSEYEDDMSSGDDETLSPPSTTSSTDSEESESDNEARTPVEEPQTSGWMTKRLADKPGFGGGGRWKKAKREWVWTLGDMEDSSIAPQSFGGVKVWGDDTMVAV